MQYGSFLGRSVREPINLPEAIPIPDGRRCQLDEIVLRSTEFTSLCPVTGQPDFGEVIVSFIPRDLILESKSFKLYLWQFREQGHFCEELAVRIADDLYEVLSPIDLTVTVVQAPRGGISIRATARRKLHD
jgi:7-cyano-7-deazaguanine reductase